MDTVTWTVLGLFIWTSVMNCIYLYFSFKHDRRN